MARGIQPTPEQLAEERHVTLQSATAELLAWDAHETELLNYLESVVGSHPTLGPIVRRLQRGNRLEDADHIELHAAVRGVSA